MGISKKLCVYMVIPTLLMAIQVQAQPLVAEYLFNDSLTSSIGGAPALVATNPLGTSGFQTDTVFGNSQRVYAFNGNASPTAEQAGLSLSTAGLLTSNNIYTVEVLFQFTQNANAWRRIVDVQNRSSDNGFYVDPSNNLDIYPVAGGAPFSNNAYHDVFLVNNNGVVTFYLDGSSQATVTTNVMAVDSNNRMNFFLDNFPPSPANNEYSNGKVALIRLYNGALDAQQIPSIPEPESYAMLLAGLGLLGFVARRRKQNAT